MCQEEDLLNPVAKIVNETLTIANIERFTGIKITIDDRFAYAVCIECARKLQKSVEFLIICETNDAVFHQLLEETIESSRNATLSLDESRLCSDEYLEIESTSWDKDQHFTLKTPESGNDKFCYSANYIDPGELSSSDSHEYSTIALSVADPSVMLATGCNMLNLISAVKQDESDEPNSNVPTKRIIYTRKKELCEQCGKLVQRVDLHATTHTQELNHACPYCPAKMTLAVNLKRHIDSVHLKKTKKICFICGTRFTSRNTYRTHMLSQHDIGEKYKCNVCPRKFNSHGNLSSHFQRFHGTQRYECRTCGQQFRIRKYLERHQRVHSTDQPFACSQCPKRFKSKGALQTHQLTHSGVRFVCELCSKSYRYKSLLNMHTRKTHPKKTAAERGT
uniref:C2H2-type domain-containing protein n=1 Tax=Anopheles farauti TaxID=69004 RepID=A0A182QQ94_9DIPT